MKRFLLIICSMLLVLGVVGTANSAIVRVDFEFTITNVIAFPLQVGDKGSGWFTYDNEIPGTIHDYPAPHHDTGYYQGLHLYIAAEGSEIYSGDASVGMLNDYFGTDQFNVGHQTPVGEEIDTRVSLFLTGPDTLWDSLPLTLPVPDFDSFTTARIGTLYNYNWSQGGIIDKQVDFTIDRIAAVPQSVSVLIDIKPGKHHENINLHSHGEITVAILSASEFNASNVDKDSLTFGRTGNEDSLAFCYYRPEDINGDGLKDLICHFYAEDTGFKCGDTEGILKGTTKDGVTIQGSDSVKIIPCKKPPKK